MTQDALLKWFIATLKADSATIAYLLNDTDAIRSADDGRPASSGIFVGPVSGISDEQWSDVTNVPVVVYLASVTEAWNCAARIRTLFDVRTKAQSLPGDTSNVTVYNCTCAECREYESVEAQGGMLYGIQLVFRVMGRGT